MGVSEVRGRDRVIPPQAACRIRGVLLRPLQIADADTVAVFLAAPHVARWWTGEAEGGLLALLDERPVGLAEWYLWNDRAEDRDALGIPADTAGVAVLVGHAHDCQRGLGTEILATLLERLGAVAVWVATAEANAPWRTVLENNDFALMAVKAVGGEQTAVYALQR
jgi:hypothetical protein